MKTKYIFFIIVFFTLSFIAGFKPSKVFAQTCWLDHHLCYADVGCTVGLPCSAPICHPDGGDYGHICCPQHCGFCPGAGDNCVWYDVHFCGVAGCPDCSLCSHNGGGGELNNLQGRVWVDTDADGSYSDETFFNQGVHHSSYCCDDVPGGSPTCSSHQVLDGLTIYFYDVDDPSNDYSHLVNTKNNGKRSCSDSDTMPFYKTKKLVEGHTYNVELQGLPIGWEVVSFTNNSNSGCSSAGPGTAQCVVASGDEGETYDAWFGIRESTPPTCSLQSCPSELVVGESYTFTADASDADGSVAETKIFKTPVSSQSWTEFCSSASSSCSSSTSFATAGDYYVVCNAGDDTGNWCTGNPWCEWPPNPPSSITCGPGWSDCTADDVCTFTVITPTPTPTPITWTIETEAICTNAMTHSQSVTSWYRLWPPNPADDTSVGPVVGSNTFDITSTDGSNNAYVGMYKGGSWLELNSSPPHSAITYGHYWAGSIPNAMWDREDLPASSYRIEFQAPLSWCPTPTACPTLSPPTGLDGKCPAPGTTGEVSWDLVAGATDYAIRVDNLADPWDSSCSAVDGPGDFCLNLPGISKDFISAQGATYGWWVHAINVCGWSDPAYGSNFSCPTPTPTPYCVMTGISYDDELLTGDSEQMNTTWNANGPMTYVDFTAVTNPDRLNICPWSDASCSLIPGDPSEHVDTGAPPWGVRYTGLDAGDPTAPITIEIQGYMDSWGGAFCPLVTRAINVRNVPWWQVGFGDVFTNDDLISKIPNSCVDSCIDDLISGVDTNGDGTFEMPAQGAALYSEVTNFTSGTVSSLGMIVDMDGQKLDVSRYTYEYFTDSIPGFSGLTVSAQDSLDQSETLNEGNVNSVNSGGNAYDVIVRNADTEIDAGGGIIDIGSEKIILFVNGTLTINSDINLNKGVGFFMAIVNGDIIIDPSVGDQYLWTTIDPELEGIYVTTSDGGDFKTGTSGVDSDVTLEVRGIVAAVGGAVELERDLVDDDTTPAEKFYYAPDQTLLLPDFFGQRVYRWKEVAP